MFQIKTTTPEDHAALLTLLFKLGYEFSNGSKTVAEYNRNYGAFAYPHVLVYPNKKDVGGSRKYNFNCGDELEYPQDITEIFTRLFDIVQERTFHVTEVGEYDAVITDKGIRVGCQLITLDKFAEIVEAVNKIRK